MKKNRQRPTETRRPPRPAQRTEHAEPRQPRTGLIYGLNPVLETLRANSRRIEKVLVADGAREHRITEVVDLARRGGITFQRLSREMLERYLEPGVNHQGVVAIAAAADYTDADDLLNQIAANPSALAVILDGVEDPRNLGAVLRTAECAGADGVFIPEHRAAGLTETVVKTAAGATEFAKIAKVRNLNRLIGDLKSNNIWVVGTDGNAEMEYSDWDWTLPTALVLGSEGRGLHRLVAENCDALVRIRMRGKIESLNVSVAAGVILFEAVRQRKSAGQRTAHSGQREAETTDLPAIDGQPMTSTSEK